jgi:uncharacterized membrane protein
MVKKKEKEKPDNRMHHRIFRTVYFVMVVVFFLLIFESLMVKNIVAALKMAFLFSLCCFVLYELLMLKHLKDKALRENAAHQAYIGLVAIVSAVFTFILDVSFGLELENSLLILAITTIVLLILTINKADSVMEKYI